MNNIIVIGASGQLGQCLKAVSASRQISGLLFPDETEANILDVAALQTLFEREKPTYVINCAAYTAVDKAESDVDIARKVNRDGPENLAKLCREYNATLIHISTDFIFEGNDVKLLQEDDIAKPISIYGLTKLEGEQVITAAIDQYFILRTSWLYSEYGNNFVKTMLRLGADRDELNIIADQVGTPTYAIDLAGAILEIITTQSTTYGIYHYSNEGVTSWYDFAVSIFELGGVTVKVNPIPTEQYPTPAKRPKFSVMDKSKLKKTFNIEVPYWRDSLSTCIKILKNQ